MAILSFHQKFQSLQQKLSKKMHRKLGFKFSCMASSVPSGYFPVYMITEEQKIIRYMIPVEGSSSIMLRALFNQFEDEIDRAEHAITLSCSAGILEAALNLSADQKHPWKKEVLDSSKKKETVS